MRYKIAIVILVLIAESVLTGLIPHSRGYLFGFLETKQGAIYTALFIYFCNYLFLDFFQAIKGYLVTKVAILFRGIRTHRVVENLKGNVKNTPQRIQEDIKLSYEQRFTVWAEYFVSGTIVIQLIIINLHVPMLVLAALIYSVISVIIAFLFNPRMTKAEKKVQEKEASFRASLHGSFNLFKLPGASKAVLEAAKVRRNYLLFTKIQLGVMSVLPYIILIPSLLSGAIDLGTLVKHQATFALIVVNAAILIQYYTVLIKGKASEERVKELDKNQK